MGCHRSMVLTILLAARHKRAHPALTPAGEGWYSIYLPRRDGRLSWPRCLITRGPGIEPMTARSEVRRPTAVPPRHLQTKASCFVVIKLYLLYVSELQRLKSPKYWFTFIRSSFLSLMLRAIYHKSDMFVGRKRCLYFVGGDVKHCTIQSDPIPELQVRQCTLHWNVLKIPIYIFFHIS